MRVCRLRWYVFVSWVASQRQGSKIRRQAIQRLERKDLGTSSFNNSLLQSSDCKQTGSTCWQQVATQRAHEIFVQETQELFDQRNYIQQQLNLVKDCLLNNQITMSLSSRPNPKILNYDVQAAHCKNSQFTSLDPVDDYFAAPAIMLSKQANPQLYNENTLQTPLNYALTPQMLKQMQPQYQENQRQQQTMINGDQANNNLQEKYSVHAALVHQQNMFPSQFSNPTLQQNGTNQNTDVNTSIYTDTIVQQEGVYQTTTTTISKNLSIDSDQHYYNLNQPHIASNEAREQEDDMVRVYPLEHPLYPRREQKKVGPNNALFQKLQGEFDQQLAEQRQNLMKGEMSDLMIHTVQNHVLILTKKLQKLRSCHTEGYFRAQALFMQFKTEPITSNLSSNAAGYSNKEISIVDFVQVALQSGTSLLELNKYRNMARLLLQWQINYLERLLRNDLALFHSYQVARRMFRKVPLFIRQKEKKSKKHYETKQLVQFYQLFKKWAHETRILVYHDLRDVRLFRTQFIYKKWREQLSLTETFRNNLETAQRYRKRTLYTKALLSLYQNYLAKGRITRFKKKWAFRKMFKRKWQPLFKQRQLLRRVMLQAHEKEMEHSRTIYQRQFDLLANVMTRWKAHVTSHNQLVQWYMAKNYYKRKLMQNAFSAVKKLPRREKAFQILQNQLQGKLRLGFRAIKKDAVQNYDNCLEFSDYRLRRMRRKVFLGWHKVIVQRRIAEMFFQRRILTALQTYTFNRQYVRPYEHLNHVLVRKALHAFKQLRIKRWKKERGVLVQRAIQCRREHYLSKQVFTAFIDNVVRQKQKSIVDSTIFEFRRHNLLEKTFEFLKLRAKIKNRERLMLQVATEFRQEKLRFKAESGDPEIAKIIATCNLENVQNENDWIKLRVWRAWACMGMKKSTMSQEVRSTMLEERLQQVLRNKGQILLVRCFLSWRSTARFAQTDSSFQSSQPRNAASAKSISHSKQLFNHQQVLYDGVSPRDQQDQLFRLQPKIHDYQENHYGNQGQKPQQNWIKITPKLASERGLSTTSLVQTTPDQSSPYQAPTTPSNMFMMVDHQQLQEMRQDAQHLQNQQQAQQVFSMGGVTSNDLSNDPRFICDNTQNLQYTDTSQSENMDQAHQHSNQSSYSVGKTQNSQQIDVDDSYSTNKYSSTCKPVQNHPTRQYKMIQPPQNPNYNLTPKQQMTPSSNQNMSNQSHAQDLTPGMYCQTSQSSDQISEQTAQNYSHPDVTSPGQQLRDLNDNFAIGLNQTSKLNLSKENNTLKQSLTISSQQSERTAFKELDEIQKQVQDWQRLQSARDDVLRQMAMQYWSIKTDDSAKKTDQ